LEHVSNESKELLKLMLKRVERASAAQLISNAAFE